MRPALALAVGLGAACYNNEYLDGLCANTGVCPDPPPESPVAFRITSLELVDPHGQDAVHSIFDRVALEQAIAQLTEDQQQVLTLKFFADMTNQEIASTIGRRSGKRRTSTSR